MIRKIQKIDYDKSNKLSGMLDEINESFGIGFEQDFVIHKISTSLGVIEEQEIVDNLALTELKLYEHFNIDIKKYKKEVFHFGLDYSESGEEQDGCERIILETPHVWSSEERYENEFSQDTEFESQKEDSNIISYKEIIDSGEGHQVEFKPALRYHFDKKKEDNIVRFLNAKAICSFLNSNGGVLFIGINDYGGVQGLDFDYSLFEGNRQDKFRNEFDNMLYYFFPFSIKPFVKLRIEELNGKEISIVEVEKSKQPVFLKNRKTDEIKKEFYMRAEASSRLIEDVEEIILYVFNNWEKSQISD